MSDPRSRSLEWIEQAKQHVPGVSDTPLVEKAIRALSLLESLVRSGCPFIFKGGTALMLHLDTTRRLSIDVDIVCPPGTDIKEYLVRLIQTGTNQVKHYSPEMDTELAAALIEDQSLNKLNRIKKISLEAFFYCRQLELLAQ